MAVDEAFESATRLLRHRDRATVDLDRRLAVSGFAEPERANVIETLTRTGVLDDARFAAGRAQTLAGRGAGDGLIRHDLASAGVSRELIDEVVSELEPESERAQRIVEKRGAGPKTARYLAGKGFSHDALRDAIAHAEDETLG